MTNLYEIDFYNLEEENSIESIDTRKFIANLEERGYELAEQIFARLGTCKQDIDRMDIIKVLQDCWEIYNHGINCGYGKFVYYNDTSEFFDEYPDTFIEYVENEAKELFFNSKNPLCQFFAMLDNGDEYIHDLMEGFPVNKWKNDIVWMYVENFINRLMEDDAKVFVTCIKFKEKKDA